MSAAHLAARLSGPVVRLAGARQAAVAALATGLQRQARGMQQVQRRREGRGLDPELLRVVILVVLVLLSLGLAVAAVRLAARPELAALVLLGGQLGGVLLRCGGEVTPLVLDAEDHRVLGWWPVSGRELLLARGAVILAAAAEATLAVAAIPLLLLAVRADPPLVAAAGVTAGLLLHGTAVAAMLLLAVQGLARLAGRRRARRLTEALGTATVVILLNLILRSLPELGAWLAGLAGWQRLLLPPLWFAAWGGWARPDAVQAISAVLAVAAAVGLIAGGARVLASRGGAEREEPATRPPGRRGDPWRPVIAWVGRWLPGRQGRALRLLLLAHLREDWRLLGVLLGLPVLTVGYLVVTSGWRLPPGSAGLIGAADWAAPLGLLLSLLGLSYASALGCSTEARAAWLVRSGVLDAGQLQALHRRVVRALGPAPVLVVAVTAGLVSGTLTVGQAALAAAPAWLALEIMLAFVQWMLPRAPFSRAWQRQGHEGRAFQLLSVLLWPLVVLPLFYLYDRGWWGPVVILGLQLGLWLALRALGRRRLRRRGLPGLAPRA